MKKLSGVAVVTTAEGERVSYTYMELDDNGNIVFFVEPGLLAGEIAGVLLYPFSPYELRGSAPEAGLRAYGRAGMYR